MIRNPLASGARLALALACAALLALAGCSSSGARDVADLRAGGGVNPEAVTESFLDDLELALQDPALADRSARERWVDRLAGYFAPPERDTQAEALAAALASFASGLGELTADERLTIELRFDGIKKLSDDNRRALVQPINGRVYLLVMRGDYITHERETPLSAIIGRSDGAVPAVKIGNAWFLSENY